MAKSVEEQRTNTNVQELSFDKRFKMIIDSEDDDRSSRRQTRFNKAAKFKVNACPEDIYYSVSRGLDRQVMTNLVTCDWIEKSLNVITTGPTGTGKTWIACALGQQATRKGYPVLYTKLSRLLEEFEIAYGDGSLAKLRTKLSKIKLLIIDDWGLAPLTMRGRYELLETIDDRIRTGSLIINSPLPIEQWHDYIADATIADVILDRVIHRAHRLELKGESMRKLKKSEGGIKHVSDK